MVLASSIKDDYANIFGIRFDIRDGHHDEVNATLLWSVTGSITVEIHIGSALILNCCTTN